jgi:predicted RNase H-like HicB family nuclease
MKLYTAVVERDSDTGLFVGYVPGLPGAHTQAESLDELNANLREVIAMLLEDGDPALQSSSLGKSSRCSSGWGSPKFASEVRTSSSATRTAV